MAEFRIRKLTREMIIYEEEKKLLNHIARIWNKRNKEKRKNRITKWKKEMEREKKRWNKMGWEGKEEE